MYMLISTGKLEVSRISVSKNKEDNENGPRCTGTLLRVALTYIK